MPNWRRPSKPAVFAILMSLAALLALLPARWTAWTGRILQPVGWFGWSASSAARAVRDTASRVAPGAEDRVRLALRERVEQLERQVGHQHVMINQLEALIDDISGVRDQLMDERARIRFAAIVGWDLSPRREVLLISKGSRHGIREGDWVAAGVPLAEHEPDATGRDLVLRQWIIGRVAQAQPFLSRVQLTTDPQFGLARVRVARLPDVGGWEMSEKECGLRGLGGGRMEIAQATEDYLAAGYPLVLLPLVQARPMAMAIGRIRSAEMLDSGMHFDLKVEPLADVRRLSHVYVISFGS